VMVTRGRRGGSRGGEQKGSRHPLIAVLSSPSSQSITPHPGALCQGLLFLYPAHSDGEWAGLSRRTVRLCWPRCVAQDRDLTGWELQVSDCLFIEVELNGLG